MKKVKFLLALIVILTLKSCAQTTSKEIKKQPNIVWLIAEDLSPDINCYGHKLVHTPNVDNLAKNGVQFMNAFAPAPVCSASRSAFMTGVHQTTLGANNHRTSNKNILALPNGVKTIGEHLEDNGYFVSYQGKTDFNFKYPKNKLRRRKLSKRKEGQPFFMVLQTYHTHRPFVINAKKPIDPSKVNIPPYYPDQPLTRKDWANYLEDVNRMDEWVGKQMAYLKNNNLLENTIVVFMGDHGRPMVRDKQFLYDGGTKVPLIISSPERFEAQVNTDLVSLLDLPKTMYKLANVKEPEMLQGIDIFSEKNEYIYCARGRSGEAEERIRSVRNKDYLFIKNEMPEKAWMQHSSYKKLRYPVYTLMHYLHEKGKLNELQSRFMADTKPEFELYDIKNDPDQINNIASELPEQTKKMHKLLLSWKEKVGDTILDPDRFDMDAKRKVKDKWAHGWYKQNGLSQNPSHEELLKFWLKEFKVELNE